MTTPIDRPIFIGALPRSGSWLFYRRLAKHPDLGWISRATRRFPTSEALSNLLRPFRPGDKPVEGSRIWLRFAREEDDTLGAEHLTAKDSAWVKDVASTQLKMLGRPRFLSKYPRHGLRMGWLDAIFPDARFIHLIRDGRGVARSVMERRDVSEGRESWWGSHPPGWRDCLDRRPAEQIGLQWRRCIEETRRVAAQLGLGPDRYIEVRYEDFCNAPKEVLERMAEFCELTWPAGQLDEIVGGIRSQNFKWQESLTTENIQDIEREAGDLLVELGYPLYASTAAAPT